MQNRNTQHLMLPYKSVAAALLFCVVLGPIGLLYSSFWAGFIMTLIGIIVVSSKLFFPILLLWIICCVLAIQAVESYNKKMMQTFLRHY